MKTAFREGLAIGLLALTLFLCTPAHSETGSTLLQACEALEREVRILPGNIVQYPVSSDGNKCWGYMGAVQDFAVLVLGGKPLLRSCLGPDTTLTQLVRVFTNYARTHPQQLHEKASQLVYRAMLEAFPCP